MEHCATCGEQCKHGEIVDAVGKQFHSRCFVCPLCRISLNGGAPFYKCGGMPFCAKCIDEAERLLEKQKQQANAQETIISLFETLDDKAKRSVLVTLTSKVSSPDIISVDRRSQELERLKRAELAAEKELLLLEREEAEKNAKISEAKAIAASNAERDARETVEAERFEAKRQAELAEARAIAASNERRRAEMKHKADAEAKRREDLAEAKARADYANARDNEAKRKAALEKHRLAARKAQIEEEREAAAAARFMSPVKVDSLSNLAADRDRLNPAVDNSPGPYISPRTREVKPSYQRLAAFLDVDEEQEDNLQKFSAERTASGGSSSRNPALGRLERMVAAGGFSDESSGNVPVIEQRRNPTLSRMANAMRAGPIEDQDSKQHMQTLGFNSSPDVERKRTLQPQTTDDDVMAMMRGANKGRNNF